MASGFATLSKDEILAVNEAAVPTSTRKRQNLACRCLLVLLVLLVLLNLNQNHNKIIPETLSTET